MRRPPAPILLLFAAGVLSCGLPDLPGKKEFETACAACHPISTPLSRRDDRAGWEKTVRVMRDRGARLTEAEVPLVADFLAKVRPPK